MSRLRALATTEPYASGLDMIAPEALMPLEPGALRGEIDDREGGELLRRRERWPCSSRNSTPRSRER